MANEKSVMAVIRVARPKFRNSADKIVFALHSIFLADGFQLNATGTPAFAVDALTASYSDVDDVPVDGWNEIEDNYAFVYTNTEKGANRVLVKCIVMNNTLLLDALGADSSEPDQLEINIDDFVGESEGTNYDSLFKNLDKLIDGVNEEVLSKLYGSSTASTSTKASGIYTMENSSESVASSGSGPPTWPHERYTNVPQSFLDFMDFMDFVMFAKAHGLLHVRDV